MKRKLFTPALIALTAFTSLPIAADAQQRTSRATTQTQGIRANDEATTPYQMATCPIYRIWMTESGVVFACNGNAMAFDGRDQPGGAAAAMNLLLNLKDNDGDAFVRYQIDPDHPACSQMSYEFYSGMFGNGTCARAVAIGIG
jgi:hypothetical protein